MILSQSISVSYDSVPNWPLKDGYGPRRFAQHVLFNPPFPAVPQVVLGLVKLDADCSFNTRVQLQATNVDANGFDLVVDTWNDSKIWGVGVHWLAHG